MSATSANLPAAPEPLTRVAVSLGLVVVAVVALLVLFRDGIAEMVQRWGSDEYNHAPLIPLVALYLLWLRARELSVADLRASWVGVAGLLLAMFLLVLGNLSAVLTLSQYALVLAVAALAVAATGLRGLRWLWVPLVYLFFMVPLPGFVENRLTGELQLVSSTLGVMVIRAAGFGVYLEGNVIDLGTYQLQVAEACSGMRYMYPLLHFGFLCAALFRGRTWQRLVIVLSTIPITILMNSFRIGVIGILVNLYGIEQAEGFIHDFEGWVVFMACLVVLFGEIWFFAHRNGQRFLEAFGLDIPPLADMAALLGRARPAPPVLAGVGLLAAAAAASLVVTRPEPVLPERQPLSTFPLVLGDWRGRDAAVDQVYLDVLKLSDYLMAYFLRPADPNPVELWVAYYDAQVTGASVHSPKSCLPGGGWTIKEMDTHTIPEVGPAGESLAVNRALITLGDEAQLVYYWFDQRGRDLTNEFAVKWYIFQDGLATRRTDGALVRVSTRVSRGGAVAEADERLAAFVRAIDPKLAYHLPGRDAPPRRLALGANRP